MTTLTKTETNKAQSRGLSVALLGNVCILFCSFVAMNAMGGIPASCGGSSLTHSGCQSALDVDGVSDRFKVARVDATVNAAQVIEFLPERNRTNKVHVADPVRPLCKASFGGSRNPQFCVPFRRERSRPEPAARVGLGQDLIHDPIFKAETFHRSLYFTAEAGMPSLKQKLFTAAKLDQGLGALLLNGQVMQWADIQIPQSWNLTSKSAVAAQLISDPTAYVAAGPLATSWSRVQFTIFGYGNDSTQADAVAAALFAFMGSFNAGAIGGQAANYKVGDRDAGLTQTQPVTYQRIVDYFIWNDAKV